MGPTSRRLHEDVTCNRAPCEASTAIGEMPGTWVGAGYPLARGLEHKALTVVPRQPPYAPRTVPLGMDTPLFTSTPKPDAPFGTTSSMLSRDPSNSSGCLRRSPAFSTAAHLGSCAAQPYRSSMLLGGRGPVERRYEGV